MYGTHPLPDYQERQSVIDSLWTSASLENVIMNLAKKYNLLNDMEESYSNEVEVGKGEFLVDYPHESKPIYSRSCFNINGADNFNDEMDPSKHRGEERTLTTLPTLGTTIHSKHFPVTDVKSKMKSKYMTRKRFSSMPDLKVSKYETAFGPDNSTVTRIYYWNGLSEDYKHYDEDRVGEAKSYPVESLDMSSEKMTNIISQDVNIGQVKSLESVNHLRILKDNNPVRRQSSSCSRSKSFADVDIPQRSSKYRVHSKSSFSQSQDDLRPSVLNENLMKSFPQCGTVYSSSKYSQSNSFNKNSLRKTGISQSVSRLNVQQCADIKTNSHSNSHYLSPYFQTCFNDEGLLSNAGQVYGSSCTLNEGHQSSVYSCNELNTPRLEALKSSASFMDLYSPLNSAGYGPGYRPILDASKERKRADFISFSNRPVSASSRRVLAYAKYLPRRHVTSTPLSLSSKKSFSLSSHDLQNTPASLSGVTPLYDSQQRTMNQQYAYGHQSHDFVACK